MHEILSSEIGVLVAQDGLEFLITCLHWVGFQESPTIPGFTSSFILYLPNLNLGIVQKTKITCPGPPAEPHGRPWYSGRLQNLVKASLAFTDSGVEG